MSYQTGNKNTMDKPLLYAVFVLLAGGLLVLGSASMVLSQKTFGTIGYYFLRQVISGGIIGLLALFITSKIPYRTWRRLALPLMIASFLLLAAVFLPHVGISAGGAKRWINLGFLSFQPSEILKLAFVVYLASWLDSRRHEVSSVSYGLIPFSIMIAIVGVFLVMQPDFGTLGIIVITSGLLYFLGGGKVSQIITICLLGVILAYMMIHLAPYRAARLTVFLNPQSDPQGIGYHVNQASIAIGSGGFMGLGFGKSLQKYNYLPEPMGDSIFAIYNEEMGFLGAILMISIFGFIFWRGMLIAKNAPDTFGRLLAGGISIGFITQAFINMAAISGLMPLTGIPLPFISYGGTSLAITLANMGILLNISKGARRG